MAAENSELLRHTLEITFYDLPATAVIRLDFTPEASTEILISASAPAIRLGASYGGGEMGVQSLSVTPRRLQFEVNGAPTILPMMVNIRSAAAFVHGRLQVPDGVQASIASAAEHIRFVGPGYWVVPLVQTDRTEPPVSKSVPSREPVKSGVAMSVAAPPATAKAAPAKPSRPAATTKPAAITAPRPGAATTAATPATTAGT